MKNSKTLNVAHVITALTVGGAQRMLIDFIRATPPWVRHHVYTLYPGEMTPQLTSSGVIVEEFDLRGARSLQAIPRLHNRFRSSRPHLVHTHLGKADFTGRIAAWMARVPSIVTTSYNTEDWKQNKFFNFLDNVSMRPASRIIAIAQGVEDYLVEYGLDRSRIRLSYIRSGLAERFPKEVIDPQRRAKNREALGIDQDTVVSIMVGRLYPQKAHDVVLRALAKTLPLMKSNHLLVMAGDGPLRGELEGLAANILPAGSFRFLGIRSDIPDLLALSDIYLMPSRWEGLGLALSEACAAGLPCIVSDVPGMKELAISCEASVFVPPEDEESLATAWARMVNDPAQRKSLGSRGRANALAKWDISLMAEEYLRIYADTCRESPRLRMEELPAEFQALEPFTRR